MVSISGFHISPALQTKRVFRCDSGGEEDRERMQLLRACLALFQGVRPFHNFTKRRLYRAPQRQKGRKGRRTAGAMLSGAS